MKKSLLIVLAVLLVSSLSSAQFTKESSYLGPSVGLYFYSSVPIIGVNYEYALSGVDLGSGTVGIGGLFRYYSWSDSWFDGTWKYTNILIGVQGLYHFKMENEKLDPFAGITLAYDASSVSWSGPSYGYNPSPSWGGLTLGFAAGGRYWFSPNLAGVVRFGAGSSSYSALDIGLDFKL